MAYTDNFIRTRWFEDIPIGEFHVFGSHTFSEQEMIEFGTLYAPQIYHTDPEQALETRYRGLIASDWHILCDLDAPNGQLYGKIPVSYTHLRAHET